MRKSRRWLLASVGASALGSTVRATTLPVPADCETYFAQDVGLGNYYNAPHPISQQETLLGNAMEYGYTYQAPPNQPDFRQGLLQHLTNAYHDAIQGGAIGSNWALCVAQAFILGQLVQYFWVKQGKPSQLGLRHLASAWAVFGRATSSCECAQWVFGPSSGTRNAYHLPTLPSGGGLVIFQVDQPCALC